MGDVLSGHGLDVDGWVARCLLVVLPNGALLALLLGFARILSYSRRQVPSISPNR